MIFIVHVCLKMILSFFLLKLMKHLARAKINEKYFDKCDSFNSVIQCMLDS